MTIGVDLNKANHLKACLAFHKGLVKGLKTNQ